MSEIGIVVYTKGSEPGTLDAKWFVSPTKGGTGKAVDGPEVGFVGKYRIKYYHEDGSFDTELDLEIDRPGEAYELLWKQDGVLRAKGTGMEADESLVAGWLTV